MKRFLILIALVAMVMGGFVSDASADYKINPFTGRRDYYEPASGSNLGDLADVVFTLTASGDLIYRNASSKWVNLAKGSNGQALVLAAGLPAWGTLGAAYGGTGQNIFTIGDLLYASGATALSKLADVAVGQVLTSGGVGVIPAWSGAPSILSLDVNYGGATGETGIDFNSINNTYSTIAQSDAEGIANKSDLRIGLDPTTRNLIICERPDMTTDFNLVAEAHPRLFIYQGSSGSGFLKLGLGEVYASGPLDISFSTDLDFVMRVDRSLAGAVFDFKSVANVELIGSNVEQAWVAAYPKINQASAGGANYVGFLMDVTETNLDSGTNELIALRVATVDKFTVDNKGYAKGGSLSASLADDAVFTTTIPDSWTGIVVVQNVTDTTSGVYHLDGTAITAINQNAAFTITQGTNDKINVYVAGNVLTVENTHAAAKTVKVMFIGT